MKKSIFDFSTTDETGIKYWEDSVTREPMNICDSPLYRFILFRNNEGKISVLVKTHHIISDGWSQVALLNRICDVYCELISEREVFLEPAPSYSFYVEDEQKYLPSDTYRKDREYWRDLLSKPSEPVSLKNLKSAAVSPVGKRRGYLLSEQLNNQIFSYCMKNVWLRLSFSIWRLRHT